MQKHPTLKPRVTLRAIHIQWRTPHAPTPIHQTAHPEAN